MIMVMNSLGSFSAFSFLTHQNISINQNGFYSYFEKCLSSNFFILLSLMLLLQDHLFIDTDVPTSIPGSKACPSGLSLTFKNQHQIRLKSCSDICLSVGELHWCSTSSSMKKVSMLEPSAATSLTSDPGATCLANICCSKF